MPFQYSEVLLYMRHQIVISVFNEDKSVNEDSPTIRSRSPSTLQAEFFLSCRFYLLIFLRLSLNVVVFFYFPAGTENNSNDKTKNLCLQGAHRLVCCFRDINSNTDLLTHLRESSLSHCICN